MTINEMMDECKKVLGGISDYKLAEELEISPSRISAYRKGREHPDVYVCFRIAEILGREQAEIIASVEALTNKNLDKRLYFKSFLTSVGLWITLAVIPVNYITILDTAYAAGNNAETRADATYKPIMRSRKIRFLLLQWWMKKDKIVRYFTCNWTRKAAFGCL